MSVSSQNAWPSSQVLGWMRSRVVATGGPWPDDEYGGQGEPLRVTADNIDACLYRLEAADKDVSTARRKVAADGDIYITETEMFAFTRRHRQRLRRILQSRAKPKASA